MNQEIPKIGKAILYWLKLGFISFGGPAGQIAIMHRDLVERKKWFSERHFLDALNFCMFLPGPEAQQLSIYLGWRLHGWRGGVAAGALFVIPSAVILFALSWLYMAGGHIAWLAAIFYGFLPAVIAVILCAVIRIGGKTLHSASLWAIAVLSFVSIYFLNVSFLIIVIAAGCIGMLGHTFFPNQFSAGKTSHGKGAARQSDDEVLILPLTQVPTWRRSLLIASVCIPLWIIPILLLGNFLGWQSTPAEQGVFFSKAALVTFGGAYAVLPYVAQQAVENFQWLTHPQMMSGLALAETTPGPLIIVLQFVGFVGAWQNPGTLSPLLAASIGAFITTWVTFVPCFLFVFLGAPYVEKLGKLPLIGASLTTITAAVVGVIFNLGVTFSTHAIFQKNGEFDVFIAVLAVAAFVAMWRFKTPFTTVLAICAALGLSSFWWK
jgi:chromate transporter